MTKYICECLDGARKCTHETPSFSAPTLCCVRAHATCHWRKVENQGVETPVPKVPEWCKVGAWVWHGPVDGIAFEQPYFKIERIDGELIYEKSHNNGFPVHYTYLKPARLRPWTYEEAPETLKVIDKHEPKRIICLFLASKNKNSVQYTTLPAWYIDTKTLMDNYMQLDGSPCGILEHKNDQGEWVK